MLSDQVRSYKAEVLDRLLLLERKLPVSFFGSSLSKSGRNYPLYYALVRKSDSNRNVVVSAGIHGEEPAGVYAALRFLEEDIDSFLSEYNFLVLPCLNPFGFEWNHRMDAEGLNVNREFYQNSNCLSAKRVMDLLNHLSLKFDFCVDLHETDPESEGEGFSKADNPREFYMWEVCPDKILRVGDRVVREVEKIAPVCKWDHIYDDKNNGGVIWYPEDANNKIYKEGTTFEGFLAKNYTPQAITLETPCGWNLERRVSVLRLALESILEFKKIPINPS